MDNDSSSYDIKGIIDAQVNRYYDASGIATIEDTTDYSGTNSLRLLEKRKRAMEWIKPRLPIVIIGIIWAAVIAHAGWMTMTLIMAVIYLDRGFLDTNIVYALVWCA